MELDGYLRGHEFMQVERPPKLWEIDTEDEAFLRMLGEMIALGLGLGNELAELVLSVANVVVEPDDDDESKGPPEGEYVAVSVRGAGEWAEDVWRAGHGPTRGLLCKVGPAANEAGAVFAYTRMLAGEGSVTAFVPRLVPAS